MAVVVVPVLCVTSTGIGDSLSCSVSASPDSSLCFTLLAASRSCWACVQWQRVQCSRASQQPWATQHREVSVVCHLRRPYHPPHSTREVSVVCHLRRPCPPLHSTWPPVSGNRCRTSPLPLPPADRTSITSRRCEKRAQKATPTEKRTKEWTEEDKSDRRFSWSLLPSNFSSSPNPCCQPAELDFYRFSSALPHSDECQHTTSSPPNDRLVLPQPKTHSLSASSMQDPSALPGGGPTYPPSFRTTISISCCWRRPGCAMPVTRPRSLIWLRMSTRSSPSPALQGGSGAMAGASPSS